MKKIISFLLFVFFTGCVVAQIDSAGIQHVISTGVQIIGINNTLIPNVPNEITGGLITMLAGFIIRFFEKRKLRKKGLLIKEPLIYVK
ncbi:MAG: hypothetical protein WCH21_02260 [Bacteroidota bacterium]